MRILIESSLVRCVLFAIVVGAVLPVAGCAEPVVEREAEPAPPNTADADRQAILEAHEALVRAYEAGSMDAFAALLDHSSDFHIFHGAVDHRVSGVDEAKKSLVRMFGRLKDTTWSEDNLLLTVNGNVGWLTSDLLLQAPALEEPFLARGTEIWVRQGQGWRLSHGHWSPTPTSEN